MKTDWAGAERTADHGSHGCHICSFSSHKDVILNIRTSFVAPVLPSRDIVLYWRKKKLTSPGCHPNLTKFTRCEQSEPHVHIAAHAAGSHVQAVHKAALVRPIAQHGAIEAGGLRDFGTGKAWWGEGKPQGEMRDGG